jgi:hypothetical protein
MEWCTLAELFCLEDWKQVAIISPILCCVYFDTLLIELSKAEVGCFLEAGSFERMHTLTILCY